MAFSWYLVRMSACFFFLPHLWVVCINWDTVRNGLFKMWFFFLLVFHLRWNFLLLNSLFINMWLSHSKMKCCIVCPSGSQQGIILSPSGKYWQCLHTILIDTIQSFYQHLAGRDEQVCSQTSWCPVIHSIAPRINWL